ncbi:hypothetical protein [Carboxylicivirga caseinilyticus]|uniref:hypothetical protein n=1 Tax=Carboxylicivirga caseinilyticus TaxID=3417572 RepID=UPI003D34199B|nr:hypothetical protein [Marinilabiliaceae bacterium A049]
MIIQLTLSCANVSDIEKLKSNASNLNEYNYFEYTFKHSVYRSYTDKESVRSGIAYFGLNPIDTLLGVSYYFDIHLGSLNEILFYNGDLEVHTLPNDSIAFYRDIKELPRRKMISQPIFEESLWGIKKWLNDENVETK